MSEMRRGPIPRTYRVPELVRDLKSISVRLPDLVSIWVGGRLPRALREQVVVAVASSGAETSKTWPG